MNEKELDTLKNTLKQKVRTRYACPLCNGNEFSLFNNFVHLANSEKKNDISYVKDVVTIPCSALICANCGYIMLNAVGTLGLLEEENKNE